MSIGRRFIDLVRSNLTSFFDHSASSERPEKKPSLPFEALSDEEEEQELRHHPRRRESVEDPGQGSYEQEAWQEVEAAIGEGARGRYRRGGPQASQSQPLGNSAGPAKGGSFRQASNKPLPENLDPRLAQLYVQLECPVGADLITLRKHYRRLMRKYHPDMHSGNPEKQRIATDLSQRLTMAYNELRRALGGS